MTRVDTSDTMHSSLPEIQPLRVAAFHLQLIHQVDETLGRGAETKCVLSYLAALQLSLSNTGLPQDADVYSGTLVYIVNIQQG